MTAHAAAAPAAGVRLDRWRPYAGRLLLLFAFCALITVGRLVCLVVQSCSALVPYDVPPAPLARPALRST